MFHYSPIQETFSKIKIYNNIYRWAKYKNELVDEILSKSGGTHCDTTIHDAPYSLRIQAENSNV